MEKPMTATEVVEGVQARLRKVEPNELSAIRAWLDGIADRVSAVMRRANVRLDDEAKTEGR